MSKSTPGPWSVYDQGKDDGPEYGAHIRSADPMFDWVAINIQNRADAHLIAAAPDLLEAARRALETIRELTDGAPEFEPGDLVAAIIKAEGR